MQIDHAFPKTTLGNDALERGAWSAEKIFRKIGIRSRHVASEDETALSLGFTAANNLFNNQKINCDTIKSIIYCTQSPDYIIPNNVSILHHQLKLNTAIPAIEYNQGCTGYLYGLFLAKSLIISEKIENVLLITADTYTKYLKEDNMGCRTVFGDGATATLVSNKDVDGIGSFVFGTNGADFQSLYLSGEGFATRHKAFDLYMDGPAIFRFTLEVIPKTISGVLEKNNTSMNENDYVIFHQANGFMLEALREKINIPKEKFCLHFSDTGNTVSSTIPIVLKNLFHNKILQTGMKILLCGFGVGLSWGAVVITIK